MNQVGRVRICLRADFRTTKPPLSSGKVEALILRPHLTIVAMPMAAVIVMVIVVAIVRMIIVTITPTWAPV